jgi:transposase InsO family protein
VIDRFSGFVMLHPTFDTLGSCEIFSFIAERMLRQFRRLPDVIVSDRGPQFVSSEWAKMLDDRNVKSITTSSYHPQGNGLAEHAVQNVVHTL